MKTRVLSIVAVLLLAGSTLNADTQVRLGMASISGTNTLELADGTTSKEFDLKDSSGFELSLVSGVDKNVGFDFRSALTLQSNNITRGTVARAVNYETSDIMLLGEFEFAYNINKYISPFVGFYGGVGVTKIPAKNENNLLTYDLGLSIGATGEIYQSFGYYAKYTSGMKGYNVDDNTVGVRLKPTSIKVGLSYTF